jgi:hypothetical protein
MLVQTWVCPECFRKSVSVPEHIELLISALRQGCFPAIDGVLLDTCCISTWEDIAYYLSREGYAEYSGGRFVRIKT